MSDHTSWLLSHYQNHLGPVVGTLQPPAGPWMNISESFFISIHRFDQSCWAYATHHMSSAQDPERLELHLLTPHHPPHQPQVVDILAACAYYHRLTNWLGLHHTVNFGIPLAAGSQLDHGFISLPYLRGPKLEWHEPSQTQCLWLIPISQSERDFKKEIGVEALEQRFESGGFNYINPLRATLA